MNGSEEFFLTRVASSTSGRARNKIPTSRELERLRSRVEQVYESNSGGWRYECIPNSGTDPFITLAGLRREVQQAADQAWPWRNDGVATIRKTFLLPANQPLKD
jgi:hypothetical protein